MTRRAAVLGHPIGHSLSPVLHRSAYAALGLDWTYDRCDVTARQLPAFLAGLDDSWAGLSLTMPLKRAVLPLLAQKSGTVAAAGGANTVLITPAGLEGHNTDVYGIVAALQQSADVHQPRSLSIVGAGATAAAAIVAARDLRAGDVVVAARRAEAAAELSRSGRDLGLTAAPVPWHDVALALRCDAVICTLPGDAAADLARFVPADPGVLLDVTYDPWPTTLAAAWLRAGGTVVPGHQMLLWQAVRQVRLMTGLEPPAERMAEALRAALSER